MTLDQPIRRSLLIAAFYLLTALTLNELRRLQVIDAEMVQRTMGILMGIGVLISANAIPKRLVPLANLSCDPAREQRLRRFCGVILVLGGLGYTLAYMMAPIAIASTLAIGLLAPATAAVGAIAVRCAWRRRAAG